MEFGPTNRCNKGKDFWTAVPDVVADIPEKQVKKSADQTIQRYPEAVTPEKLRNFKPDLEKMLVIKMSFPRKSKESSSATNPSRKGFKVGPFFRLVHA